MPELHPLPNVHTGEFRWECPYCNTIYMETWTEDTHLVTCDTPEHGRKRFPPWYLVELEGLAERINNDADEI